MTSWVQSAASCRGSTASQHAKTRRLKTEVFLLLVLLSKVNCMSHLISFSSHWLLAKHTLCWLHMKKVFNPPDGSLWKFLLDKI